MRKRVGEGIGSGQVSDVREGKKARDFYEHNVGKDKESGVFVHCDWVGLPPTMFKIKF